MQDPSPVFYTAYLDESLTLSSTGEWLHQGNPFQNKNLIALFHRSIVWDEKERRYFVHIGKERASFRLEDTAYFVQNLIDYTSPWEVRLMDSSQEVLKPETLTLGNKNQIYCLVKGNHKARFNRTAHQVLLSYTNTQDTLSIDGKQIKIL